MNRTMSRTQTESHDVPEYCSELLNILVDDPINMWMITCQMTRDCTQLGPPALLEEEQRQPSLGLPSAARPPPRATPDSPHASPSIASRLASDITKHFAGVASEQTAHTPFAPTTHIRQSNPVTPSPITTPCALGFAGPGKEVHHRAQCFDPSLAVRAPG
jgi:hypothetical protein